MTSCVPENEAAYQPKRFSNSRVITLNASPEKVFPLFGPAEEKKWAEGWNYRPIFPGTDAVEAYAVFETDGHASHETKMVWVITKYSPRDMTIEYTTFTSERTGIIHIQCTANDIGTTDAEITYLYTGLTENGNRLAMQRTAEQAYQQEMIVWERLINHYLETGQTYRHSHDV